MLDRLMRLPSRRARFEAEYRDRSLDLVLQAANCSSGLAQDGVRRGRRISAQRISFVRVRPGQVLFRRVNAATDLYSSGSATCASAFSATAMKCASSAAGRARSSARSGLLALSARDASKSRRNNRCARSQPRSNSAGETR